MSKRSRENLDATSTPGPPTKRLQTDHPTSSPFSSSSSTAYSTPGSASTPRTPFSIPSDSPSNPFGLKKSLVALDLPPSIPFGRHVVLRFTFVQERVIAQPETSRGTRKHPVVFRVVQIPTNYTFRHLHKLIFFLFASDVGRHHTVRQPTPRAAKGKGRAVSKAQSLGKVASSSSKRRPVAGVASLESITRSESWNGHVFEVYKANKEHALVSDAEESKGRVLPTGRLWRKLSSVRERHIFRDLYGAADAASKLDDADEDDDDEEWTWEAEDDFTIAHLWPKGPSLGRAIIYHHNAQVSIHIGANRGSVPHRKGSGNLPYVFFSQGSAGDTIQISHDIQNQRKNGDVPDEEEDHGVPTPPSSNPTTASQINRWNALGVFSRFLKREDERERQLRGQVPMLLDNNDSLSDGAFPPSDDIPFPSDAESDSGQSAYSDSVLFPFASSAFTPFPAHPAHRKRVQSAERRLERLTRSGLSDSRLSDEEEDVDKKKAKKKASSTEFVEKTVAQSDSPDFNPFEDFINDEVEV